MIAKINRIEFENQLFFMILQKFKIKIVRQVKVQCRCKTKKNASIIRHGI